MQIIIRLDDITPDMSWERFLKVKDILDKYGIHPIIGVVPDCKDEVLNFDDEVPFSIPEDSESDSNGRYWNFIKSLQELGWTIAQHGYNHTYVTEDAGVLGINPFSEFAGLPYEEQYEKIKSGRDIFASHGISTELFMAPGHTFDDNTIKALKMIGFSSLTDGLYDKAYVKNGILCVPCRLAEYRNVYGLDTLCFHTNLMNDDAIAKLEEFISSHRDDIVDFDVDGLRSGAVEWTPAIARVEAKVLATRRRKDKVANSPRLAWYMSYTNHSNSKVKWAKRVVCLPLLLTAMYKKNKIINN